VIDLPQRVSAAESSPVREAVVAENPPKPEAFNPLPSYQPNRFVIRMHKELMPYLRYGESRLNATTGLSTPSVYLDTSMLKDYVEYTDEHGKPAIKTEPFKETKITLTPAGAAEVQIVLAKQSGLSRDFSFALFNPETPAPRNIQDIDAQLTAIEKIQSDSYHNLLTPEQHQALANQKDTIPLLTAEQKNMLITFTRERDSRIDALQNHLGKPNRVKEKSNTPISLWENSWIALPDDSIAILEVTGFVPRIERSASPPSRGN
jgi:hypothetical protein